MKKLILASASPRRKEILSQAGFVFEIMPAYNDEIQRGDSPEEIAENLARDKAEHVAGRCEEPCLVLGADTIVVCDGEIMGKPADEEDAASMIRRIQGRAHQVYTGVAIADREGSAADIRTFHQRTDVWVYPMTEEEIWEYVNSKDGEDKAGSYGIQGPFARYVEKIHGDYLNVVGLPLSRLCMELKAYTRE